MLNLQQRNETKKNEWINLPLFEVCCIPKQSSVCSHHDITNNSHAATWTVVHTCQAIIPSQQLWNILCQAIPHFDVVSRSPSVHPQPWYNWSSYNATVIKNTCRAGTQHSYFQSKPLHGLGVWGKQHGIVLIIVRENASVDKWILTVLFMNGSANQWKHYAR